MSLRFRRLLLLRDAWSQRCSDRVMELKEGTERVGEVMDAAIKAHLKSKQFERELRAVQLAEVEDLHETLSHRAIDRLTELLGDERTIGQGVPRAAE